MGIYSYLAKQLPDFVPNRRRHLDSHDHKDRPSPGRIPELTADSETIPRASGTHALPGHGRGREFESLQDYQNLSNTYGPRPVKLLARAVQLEAKSHLMHRKPWALCGSSMLPAIGPSSLTRSNAWAVWAPFFVLVVCWRRQQILSLLGRCPVRPTPGATLSWLPGSRNL